MSESDGGLRRMQQLMARDMLLCAFPHRRVPRQRDLCKDNLVYTLHKAKTDIDVVAKHATDIAQHVIVMSGTIDAKLESFKTEILAAIDQKFAELARTIQGEGEAADTSAVTDLAARVSLLKQGLVNPVETGGHENEDHSQPQRFESPESHPTERYEHY